MLLLFLCFFEFIFNQTIRRFHSNNIDNTINFDCLSRICSIIAYSRFDCNQIWLLIDALRFFVFIQALPHFVIVAEKNSVYNRQYKMKSLSPSCICMHTSIVSRQRSDKKKIARRINRNQQEQEQWHSERRPTANESKQKHDRLVITMRVYIVGASLNALFPRPHLRGIFYCFPPDFKWPLCNRFA